MNEKFKNEQNNTLCRELKILESVRFIEYNILGYYGFYCMEVTTWILLLQQKLQINGIYLREE